MPLPPEPPDEPLTKEQLAQVKRGLGLLSVSSVAAEYQRAYEECRMSGSTLPKASAVQRLVAAWYQLWKWRSG